MDGPNLESDSSLSSSEEEYLDIHSGDTFYTESHLDPQEVTATLAGESTDSFLHGSHIHPLNIGGTPYLKEFSQLFEIGISCSKWSSPHIINSRFDHTTSQW